MSEESSQVDRPQKDRSIGCLIRLFWMMLGYLILIFAAVSLAKKASAFSLSYGDLVYWVVVAGMIAARYWDIAHLGGKTSDGQRTATMADWKRYSIILAAVALGVWIVLNAVPIYRG